MNQEKRPGGLTALAVINFVFFGLNILGLLSLAATYAGLIPTEQMTEEQRTPIEALQNMSLPVFISMFLLSLAESVLLLLSGIGYLKQKKFMGWILGNLYAIVSIINNIASIFFFFTSEMEGGGFRITTIIGLIYPVVTLILLNTTFKEDLTN